MPSSRFRSVATILSFAALAACALAWGAEPGTAPSSSTAATAASATPAAAAAMPGAAPPSTTQADPTAGLPPDVFVKSRWIEVTRADWDRTLAKLPDNMRWEFATSPKRVQDIINNLLLVKTLAAQARADGVQPDAASTGTKDGAPKSPVDPDRALANAELARIDAAADSAFATDKGAFEQKAREIYTVDRDKYKLPEQRVFSDIAVSIAAHGDDGAKARAEEARAKVVAGGDWNTVTREYSDDAATKDKGGVLPPMSDKELPSEIAKDLLALAKVGDISQPLKTGVAWHIARLDAIHPPRTQPFDEVRDSIMASLRAQYLASQRNLRFEEINRDPTLRINQAAIDLLVNRVDAQGLPAPSAAPSSSEAPSPSDKPSIPPGK